MKIYKTQIFHKWQNTEKINDNALYNAIKEVEQGLVDAELGGNLIKKRVARPGLGKRSGYRVLIATKRNDKWFFIDGFAKNEKDNIEHEDLIRLRKLAQELLTLSQVVIGKMLEKGTLQEIENG